MERDREDNAAAAGAGAGAGTGAKTSSRWEASLDGVIVLPAGSAAPRQPTRQQRERERERERERVREQQEQESNPPWAGDSGEQQHPEPPEKVYYKTKLCEKFESGGKCAYEDGCTFAHGHAELRPPLPVPAADRKRRTPPPAPPSSSDATDSYGGGGHYGKVCFLFRDRGTCHFGDRCSYAHASAAEVAEMRYPGGPRSVEHALRNAPPLARAAYSPGSRSSRYAPAAAAREHPSAAPAAAVGEDGRKLTRLELLGRKKTRGIYGDWPEED